MKTAKRKSQDIQRSSVFCPPMVTSDLDCDSYIEFVFEVDVCNIIDDPERHENLVKFGTSIYPVGKKVGFRSVFSSDHFFHRISLFLLDCTAHIADEDMLKLRNLFDLVFPIEKAPSVVGNRIRVISTGSLYVIMDALLKARKGRWNICDRLLKPQSAVQAQDRYKHKYVLIASSLIEIFHRDIVRVFKSNNPVLNYGLFLTATKMKNKNEIYLCCGVNMSTHSRTTAASMTDDEPPTKRNKNSKSSNSNISSTQSPMAEYRDGSLGGLFGVPYYINSVSKTESPTVDLYENKNVVVQLYKSGVDGKPGHFLPDRFTVDMTYIRLRQDKKGKNIAQVGDELMWKYHEYS